MTHSLTRRRAAIAATTLLMVAAGAATAQSGSLTTDVANNGSGGVFMDFQPTAQAIEIVSFETYISGTNPTSIEIWVRDGSYVGFDDSSVGWTLHETVNGVGQGSNDLAEFTLTMPLELDAGVVTAVYFHTVSGGGIRYNGTNSNPPQETWSNADLTLFSNVARTGTTPFGGSRFSPRTFAGVIHYDFAGPTDPFDVRILGSADPSNIGIGDNTTLTFEVRNPSTADVTGVVVDIELPAGLDYVSDDRNGTLVGNVLTANLGDLPIDQSTTINVIANASGAGEFLVTGEVDINEPDPDPSNNIVMVPVDVGETDLGVAMTADANPVVIDSNGEVNFTIDYENFGPVGAGDVQIVFTAPPELNITGTSAGTIVGSTVTVDLAAFPAFNTGSFTVNTNATAPNTNAVATVEISHAGPDPDPSNTADEVSLLIVQSAADFPAIDTIFTNVESLDNSNVPGRPGFKFRNTATGTITGTFQRPYASPNGDLWIMRADVDADLAQRQVILVGAETQGTTVLQRGDLDPVQPPFGFNAIGIIDIAMSINDSGSWAARTRNDDSPVEHFILKFDAATAEFSKVAKSGDPVPGIPGAEYSTLFNSANITNTGQVGFIAGSFDGVPSTEDRAAIFNDQVLHQRGVTAPTGIGLDPTNTWNFLTANTFEMNADGTSHIVRGTVNNASGENNVTAVNNEAVVRSGNPIPGDTVLNADAGTPHNQIMNADGDWVIRGQVSGGDRYVLFNGDIVAWTGGPTGLPDNSVWDNSGFTQNFFGTASRGDDIVIGGRTDNPDESRRDVYVLICGNGSVVEIMRAGDPVDLSGNGQFDDNAFLDRWTSQNDRVFMNDTHLYFVAQVRDTFEDNNNRFGQGFFRVELPDCGAAPCPADLNGDGVVDADDFFLFLQWFADADPRADINNDGVIDADDFFDYLSLFAQGC